MAAQKPLDHLPAYAELQRLAGELRQTSLEQLFASDPARAILVPPEDQ